MSLQSVPIQTVPGSNKAQIKLTETHALKRHYTWQAQNIIHVLFRSQMKYLLIWSKVTKIKRRK